MTTFTAYFRTPYTWAIEEIDAATPDQALRQAHALATNDINALDWCSYDTVPGTLEEIEITDSDGAEAFWQSDHLALQLAAPDLVEALTALLDQIDSLTGESSCIDEDIRQGDAYRSARTALADAKGGCCQ